MSSQRAPTTQEAYKVGYAQGLIDGAVEERARRDGNIASLLSGLLDRYADVATAFQRVAQSSREQRIRRELREMITNCHRVSRELGRPRGYIWRGTERGDHVVALTPDGNWPDTDAEPAKEVAA